MEENTQSTPEITENQTTNNYIDAINDLKANTVSKDDYNKLVEENKQLLESLVNGNYKQEAVEVKEFDLKACQDALFNKELTNLEFIKNALDLREHILTTSGKDVFLPNGKNYIPTDADISTVNRVVETLRDCIEQSEGNTEVFSSLLQSRATDPNIMRRK